MIPAWWQVPGAQAALTTATPKAADQTLPAVPATVTQIATSGAEPPSPLFRATAPRHERPIGVAVGVYDIGTNDLGSLRQALTEAVPDHVGINEVPVSRFTGLEVVRSPVEVPDKGGLLYATDVWVEVPHCPGRVAVLRFWRVGSSWDDDSAAAAEQLVAGRFLFLLPTQFRGRLNRWALRHTGYFNPPDPSGASSLEHDGCRAAGWRLGGVFHTAQLTDRTGPLFMNPERPADDFLATAVLVAWIAVVWRYFSGRGEDAVSWVYYVGSLPIFGFARGLRRGRRSVFGLLATLAIILALGLKFS